MKETPTPVTPAIDVVLSDEEIAAIEADPDLHISDEVKGVVQSIIDSVAANYPDAIIR